MSESIKAYVLMGLKNCGKSTQGQIISEKTGIPFVDTDVLIEQETMMKARELYIKKGVGAFAIAEENACEFVANEYYRKSVIVASGGGICDNPPALIKLRPIGPFVFLNLNIDQAMQRVESKIKMVKPGVFENAPSYVIAQNPINMDEVHEILIHKYQSRIQQYLDIADIVIDVDNNSIEQATDNIMRALF